MLYRNICIEETPIYSTPSFPRKRESMLTLNLKWIPAFAPQGYSDLLSAKALAKSYAGMTDKKG
jgi:hypothetical protein